MTANVVLKERRVDTAAISMPVEAADLETIKNAVAQWIVYKLRLEQRRFDVVSITPVS